MNDINEFCEKLGSTSPTPGGGAAAALTLALAAGCAEKAARFSIQESEKHGKTVKIFAEIRGIGIQLSNNDQTAFSGWQEARRLPKNGDAEKKIRAEKINFYVAECVRVPFEICKNALRLTKAILDFAPNCNRHLISDAGIGAFLSDSAFEAGRINIEINKPHLKDNKLLDEINLFFSREYENFKSSNQEIASLCGKILKE